MKILLMVTLVLHFLMELMAAVALIGGPEGIGNAGAGNMWSMHYGFAAITISTVGLWAWPDRYNPAVVTFATGLLTTFHCLIFGSLLLAGDQQAGVIIHSVLAAASIVMFSLRKKIRGDIP